MSIHEVAVKFASYLAREVGSTQRQELRMAYGMEILLGELIKVVCLVLLSWLFGVLPEVLTISVTAGILRLASGGEHCSKYYRCLIGGTIWFLLLGWGVHWLNPWLNQWLYIIAGISFISCMSIAWKYAPGETENKPIRSNDERERFKKLSIMIILIYGLIMIIFSNTELLTPFVMPIATGIAAQAFTVAPTGYRFMHFVDRFLSFSLNGEKEV